MDSLELRTLRDEMEDDCRVALACFSRAQARFERKEEMAYEACAHQLCQMYNAIEQMGLRVAKVFENSIDDEKGWHSGLLNRLSIRIEGIRPPLLPEELKLPLHELRGFRHVFVHAYDLRLDPDKLALLLKYATQVAGGLRLFVQTFIERVAHEQNLKLT